ncbi:hypothetical protein Tco_1157562 [Tanacetum coccineum]
MITYEAFLFWNFMDTKQLTSRRGHDKLLHVVLLRRERSSKSKDAPAESSQNMRRRRMWHGGIGGCPRKEQVPAVAVAVDLAVALDVALAVTLACRCPCPCLCLCLETSSL